MPDTCGNVEKGREAGRVLDFQPTIASMMANSFSFFSMKHVSLFIGGLHLPWMVLMMVISECHETIGRLGELSRYTRYVGTHVSQTQGPPIFAN